MRHVVAADVDACLGGDPDTTNGWAAAHLAVCEACNAEWRAVLQTHERLLDATVDSAVPVAIAGAVSAAGWARVASRIGTSRRHRWVGFAAVATIAVALGAAAASYVRNEVRVAPEVTATAYLFLLTGSQAAQLTADERAAIGTAFRRWNDSLASRGIVERQGQLQAPMTGIVGASADRSSAAAGLGDVEGYFVVHAADDGSAMRLAESCPYLRYGGTIVVRRQAGRG